jgi:signal transduction histidine kinase
VALLVLRLMSVMAMEPTQQAEPVVDGRPIGAPRASGRRVSPVRAGILALVGLAAVLMLATLYRVMVVHAAGPQGESRREWVVALIFTLIGARVADRHPGNAVGWLLLAIGVTSAVSLFATSYASTAVLISWLAQWIWWPGVGLVPLALLLFPDGRLPSARWRPAMFVAVAGFAVPILAMAAAAAIQPNLLTTPGVINTISGATATIVEIGRLGLLATLAGAIAAFVAIAVRYRRSRGDEHQQLKWLLAAAALVPIAGLLEARWDVPGAWLVGAVVVPVAAGVAILKYGLYEIDPIINRSLVYGALTAVVVGLYIGGVTLLGTLFQRTGLPVALLMTGVVAVVFQPLRDRLQRAVDRLMYGQRNDPYTVLSRLGQRLEAVVPEAVLESVADTVAQTLKLPYVAIELRHGDDYALAAATGRPVDRPLRLPLSHQGEVIGRLSLGPRAPGEAFSSADLRLLTDVARQAGVAAHAVRLTADLQRSRERLVTAREEERRRLRRDLHDGLGAAMAGIVLQLGAARTLVRRDPDAAGAILETLQREAQNAITDIRRLVYDLRPPQLDELGLLGALQEHAARLARSAPGGRTQLDGLTVTVQTAPELPALPAAVEVAAYRIATEALTNVARHARASDCQVRLWFDGALHVEVRDDGRGSPEGQRSGVGMASMRERAAELGGTCVVERPAGGGTVVRARLPVQGW